MDKKGSNRISVKEKDSTTAKLIDTAVGSDGNNSATRVDFRNKHFKNERADDVEGCQ